jgi:hypothetical protein
MLGVCHLAPEDRCSKLAYDASFDILAPSYVMILCGGKTYEVISPPGGFTRGLKPGVVRHQLGGLPDSLCQRPLRRYQSNTPECGRHGDPAGRMEWEVLTGRAPLEAP